MTRLLTRASVAAMLLASAACQRPAADYREIAADPELLHASVDQVTDAMMESITSPPVAARTYAYAAIAAYEAVRHGQAGYATLAGQLKALEPVPAPPAGNEVLLPLAGVAAYLTVAEALVFAPEKVVAHREGMVRELRARGVPRAALDGSLAYGEAVGRHVLAWSASDGIKAARAAPRLDIRARPGLWIPTPPAYMDAVEANWGMLRPFVLDSAAEVVPPPMAPFDLTPGSSYHRQLTEVYEVGRSLTPEQKAIAGFWDCNPYVVQSMGHLMSSTKKISPGGHWMGITAATARRTQSDMVRTAEAYTRVAMALSDGFVSSWAEKYRTVRIRPVTSIHETLDPAWQPVLQTPPFPEYPSGHSVISSAAAEVLTALYGDGHAFTDSTELRFGLPPRSFRSFRHAADEAAISRLYGGIHFRDAIENGLVQGREIGRLAAERIRTREAPPLAAAGR